ncbi:MAG: DmsC/YnfH family molybdoenzyme membrane anchor subunit [Sphingomonadales bacterium]
MHPAKSVIFFTTTSGAGYGMLIMLFAFSFFGDAPPGDGLMVSLFALAFGLIISGLLSSAIHLGHPERAWRSLSQWRSSWLSREGVLAILTFIPALGLVYCWWEFGIFDVTTRIFSGFTAFFCLATVWSTGMIYASLRAIPAWNNPWTLPTYLSISVMSGSMLLLLLGQVWGLEMSNLPILTVLGFTFFALVIKALYWVFLKGPPTSTAESATGLKGKVTLLDAPHDSANYLMKEMGFQIARKHARRLRIIATFFGFFYPILFLTLALFTDVLTDLWLTALATGFAAIGIITERWLFFAEAKHVVTLYYGEEKI